jgi:hypothetical protein
MIPRCTVSLQDDGMGGVGSTHGINKKCMQNFSSKASREETTSKTNAWMGR